MKDAERPSVADGPRPSPPARAPTPSRPSHPSRPPSPSRPSQPPRPWKGAWRVAVAGAWIAVQMVLVVTADRRIDGAFGFRMFAESSTIKVALYREVAGESGELRRVHVDGGVWSARDPGGIARRFAWTDRVRRRDLASFDTEMSATYSVAAHVARLKAALDDVGAHTPDDAETRRFLLEVTVRRNGREPHVVHLASPERGAGGS